MNAVMIEGDPDCQYGSTSSSSSKRAKSAHRHAITAAAAAGAVRYGWNLKQFSQALMDWPSRPGSGVRAMSQDSAHRYIDAVWERAKTLVKTVRVIDSRHEAIFDLVDLRSKIAAFTWRGTAATSAMRVLMAHVRAAFRAGGRMHTLSYREAAEIAGCTPRTAYLCATKRLGRWLRLVENGTSEEGSTWCLLDGTSQQRHTPRGAQPGGAHSNVSEVRNGEMDGEVIETLMSLDAFAHRGLGASSLKIVAALHRRDRQTVAELVESATVSPATAYRHIKRLAEHDLVTRDSGLWTLTETGREALSEAWEGWDTVAAKVGTYGTAWRRQQAHRDQRAVWLGMVVPRIRTRSMPDVTPVRGDEVHPDWVVDGEVIDPATGEVIPDMVIASDGRLLFINQEPSYEELVRMNQLAQAA
ncbi:helix-turn-helix domain-containing protein [Streptomyces sp. NPDC018055]|uniref:helix-turn-helix domain-containing protein n=1 Tax=Streptomyces sp. NPDC018055 TaxID=3365038 RepID=UPI0037AD3C45